MVQQDAQILLWRPAVLVLGRERVAGEEEDLLGVVKEAVAARLTGCLLHLLEAQGETVLAEKAPRELGRVDGNVASDVGPTAIEYPGRRLVAGRLGGLRGQGPLGSEIEELELVRGQRGPERLDLVEAVE